jgi:hypothetical protein
MAGYGLGRWWAGQLTISGVGLIRGCKIKPTSESDLI